MKNIIEENELPEEATIKDYLIVQLMIEKNLPPKGGKKK